MERSPLGHIALDAMGGDGAPLVSIEGALDAVTTYGIPVCLVGPAKLVRRELGMFRGLPDGLEIVDAPEVVSMDDPPLVVMRSKRRSSLGVCAELVGSGKAVAMVTARPDGSPTTASPPVSARAPMPNMA